jgi:predicted Ser/Thr protein kinase
MEETIERIVGFFRHASQGLEERKQILYLLGPSAAASRRSPSGSRR